MSDNATPSGIRPRPKVALFTKDFRGGGAEKTWVSLAGLIAEPGDIDVDLVVCSACGPYAKDVSPKVRVVDLRAGRMVTSLPALIDYLREQRPTAILSALEHSNVCAIIGRIISGAPTRVVISVHNSLSRSLQSPSLKTRAELVFIRATYKHADAIVAVSSGVADDLAALISLPRHRIDVINNPTVTETMLTRSREPLRHPWFAPGEPPVILNVGRLNFQKDQAMLIRAFAAVRERVNARLLILGEGEERAALEKLATDLGLRLGLGGDVLMPGFVDNPFMYMAHSAVFALSSRFEGAPAVLIEAIACGSATVSTDCPSGPREILAGGAYGLLTPVGDVEAFAEALIEGLSSNLRPNKEAWEPYLAAQSAANYRAILLKNTLYETGGANSVR